MDEIRSYPAAERGNKNELQPLHYTHSADIEQFRASMIGSIGTAPELIIGDGQLHRFKIEGKLNGAYVLHLDGRAAIEAAAACGGRYILPSTPGHDWNDSVNAEAV
ncbi:MAG: hypothetical protein PHY54_01575 [Methylococcales bacterium]|nr:hypothetical protein [Methylococcales bacterium]